jgi:hypothetical protein
MPLKLKYASPNKVWEQVCIRYSNCSEFLLLVGIIESIIIEFKGDNMKWKGGRKSSIGDDTFR